MSISVSVHTKRNEKFEVEAYLTSGVYEKNYVVVKVDSRSEDGFDNVTIFPSYEQVKEMHKQLSKLMKEIATIEKRTKNEQTTRELLQAIIPDPDEDKSWY